MRPRAISKQVCFAAPMALIDQVETIAIADGMTVSEIMRASMRSIVREATMRQPILPSAGPDAQA